MNEKRMIDLLQEDYSKLCDDFKVFRSEIPAREQTVRVYRNNEGL